MILKEQKIEFFRSTDSNDNTIEKECKKWIDKGYIIHQIIPYGRTPNQSYYLLLYKF
jgi:hypothetical protein